MEHFITINSLIIGKRKQNIQKMKDAFYMNINLESEKIENYEATDTILSI